MNASARRTTYASIDRRIEELLTRMGLWDRRKETVVKWSRGMKQKLAIARAVLHRPDLVFLDELRPLIMVGLTGILFPLQENPQRYFHPLRT